MTGSQGEAMVTPPLPLDPRVVRQWRIGQLITTAIFAAALLGGGVLLERRLWALVGAGVIVALGLIAMMFLAPARYARWRYSLQTEELRLWHGVLWRTASVVLYSRIQHVDTQQGPLERALGLNSVVVYTAGTVGASLTIPGLDADAAESLRDRLARLSAADDAV